MWPPSVHGNVGRVGQGARVSSLGVVVGVVVGWGGVMGWRVRVRDDGVCSACVGAGVTVRVRVSV